MPPTPTRRDDVGTYLRGRQAVLGRRPMVSSDPRMAAHDLAEFLGRGGVHEWIAELASVVGGGIVPTALTIELAKVPSWAEELSTTVDAATKESLVAAIERAVVDIMTTLQGGGS